MEVTQIIGKGGFAAEVACYVDGPVKFFEYDCEGIEKNLPTLIAIGDGQVRKKIREQFTDLWYTSLVKGTHYGVITFAQGLIMCPGTILTTKVRIGLHVIINLNCTIGHDCVIGDFVTVSPGANISGQVTIGDNCYIGTNAVIREKITICDNVVIGAGGVVVKDITEPGVYVGNPVRKK